MSYRSKQKRLEWQRRYVAERRKLLFDEVRKGKYVYAVFNDGRVVKDRGKKYLARTLFVGVHVIEYALRVNNGYCKTLDCWFVNSSDKISDNEAIKIAKFNGLLDSK